MTSPSFRAGPPSPRDEALDWFVRRRDPGFPATEEPAFQAWLGTDPAHGEAYAHWEREWRALDAVPQATRQAWRAPAAGPGLPPVAGAPARATAPLRRRRLLLPAFAGAASLAAIGTGGVLGWRHWLSLPLYEQIYETARGQQLDTALPDGSRLQMDTTSRLAVRYDRRGRELQLLDGQAAFDVRPDAARPFRVSAGPLRASVVGTRFSVRHTPAIDGTQSARVAVESGRVRVEHLAAIASGRGAPGTRLAVALLEAGQQLGSDAEGLTPPAPLPLAGIAPWREYRVRFDQAPLARALAEFERYGEQPLVIRDPAVAALAVSGVFDPRDPATFQRLLAAALPVRLRRLSDGRVEIVRAP